MQDLFSTDPTQETRPTIYIHIYIFAQYVAPTRQRELDHSDHTDHTDHTDQGSIFPERSRSRTVVGIYHTEHTDHLS